MKKQVFRWLIYLLGMVLLATGLTLNTKTGLGVSAIVSVPYTVSQVWHMNFGNATFVMYVLFVLLQMLLHLRSSSLQAAQLGKTLLRDVLQLPLSLLFTRLMNLIAAFVPFVTDIAAEILWLNLLLRLLVLLLAVVLTGIGAAMTLNMHLVPNPGDGIVQTLAQWRRTSVGTMKNRLDILCVLLSLVLGLAFGGRIIGIGLGTVVAALGIGRVIHMFEKCCKQTLCSLAGIEST